MSTQQEVNQELVEQVVGLISAAGGAVHDNAMHTLAYVCRELDILPLKHMKFKFYYWAVKSPELDEAIETARNELKIRKRGDGTWILFDSAYSRGRVDGVARLYSLKQNDLKLLATMLYLDSLGLSDEGVIRKMHEIHRISTADLERIIEIRTREEALRSERKAQLDLKELSTQELRAVIQGIKELDSPQIEQLRREAEAIIKSRRLKEKYWAPGSEPHDTEKELPPEMVIVEVEHDHWSSLAYVRDGSWATADYGELVQDLDEPPIRWWYVEETQFPFPPKTANEILGIAPKGE